ncbi:MAG TPA: Pr6Pr family membrane protein [Microbacterium sp.]|nr:Pr6Pr family membrane protein [Microbacterium sp.]
MLRSPLWSLVWSLLRLAMAVAIVAAIVAQLVQSVTGAMEAGRDVVTIIANFFSFFTILSNAASAVVLTIAAIWYFSRGRRAKVEPRWLAFLLAAVTTYMVVTGIVYNTLLRGIALEPGSIVAWSNEILHLVGPIFLLADLFVGPFRRALPWRTVTGIVIFPLIWVAYTLLRASFITNPGTGDPYWYPYPFLNPNNPGGWGSVVVYVIVIAVAIIAAALLVVWVGRRRGVAAEVVHGSADRAAVL